MPEERMCPRHPHKELQFVCADPTRSDLVFKCEFCILEQKLHVKNLLTISQIKENTLKTVLWHWPLPEEGELIEKVRELSIRPKSDLKYKEEIDKYFKGLRIEIMAMIDVVEAQMKEKAKKLWDFDEKILQLYNTLSAKDALKTAISKESVEIEELSNEVREIVNKVLLN